MKLRRMLFFMAIVVLVLLTATSCMKKKGTPKVEPCGVTTESQAALDKAEAERQAALQAEALAAKEREAMQAQYRQDKVTFESTSIYFAFDQSDLTDESQAVLNEKADFLKKYADATIVIEGNCDERGSVEYNLALGERRADSARKFLVDLGVDAGRITTVSYGEERPKAQGNDEESWAQNRRDDFKVQ